MKLEEITTNEIIDLSEHEVCRQALYADLLAPDLKGFERYAVLLPNREISEMPYAMAFNKEGKIYYN